MDQDKKNTKLFRFGFKSTPKKEGGGDNRVVGASAPPLHQPTIPV
jgi:hypothetical protein